MELKEVFKNVFTYASGMEDWCKNAYMNELHYTFCSDFAIADWYGPDSVGETYDRVKESWISDYKAWTEVVIALNMLSWAHNQLKAQGIDGRDGYIRLYSKLYSRATSDFYDKYGDNSEICRYFFDMTD